MEADGWQKPSGFSAAIDYHKINIVAEWKTLYCETLLPLLIKTARTFLGVVVCMILLDLLHSCHNNDYASL